MKIKGILKYWFWISLHQGTLSILYSEGYMLSFMNEVDPWLLLSLCVLYGIQNQIFQHIRWSSFWSQHSLLGLLNVQQREVQVRITFDKIFLKKLKTINRGVCGNRPTSPNRLGQPENRPTQCWWWSAAGLCPQNPIPASRMTDLSTKIQSPTNPIVFTSEK